MSAEPSILARQIAIEHELAQRKLENYQPYPKQLEFHNRGARYRERGFLAANQSGKEGPVSSMVQTPDGARLLGDIRVGDDVLGRGGEPTRVTGVFPQGVKPIYRLEFDDDAVAWCGLEHLWTVQLPSHRFSHRHSHGRREPNPNHGKWTTLTLREILTRYGTRPRPISRVAIPTCEPVWFDPQPTAIPPYLLGALIGDGCLVGSGITFSSADAEVVERVEQEASKLGSLLRHTNGYDHRLCEGSLRCELRNLGLLGKRSWEKSVPATHLHQPAPDRLNLLRGLMDTDGTALESGCAEFCSTSEALASQVRWLAWSLGGKAKISGPRRTTYTHNGEKRSGRPSWRVRLVMPEGLNPFWLPRKADRWRPTARTENRVLRSVTLEREEEAVCIRVEADDSLYLCDDFVVTHNTFCAGAETAYHATGEYPEWWEGRRFDQPVKIWAASVSGESTRDTVQRMMMGDVGTWGTGMIPRHQIIWGSLKRARGVADLLDMVKIRHKSGGESTIKFKTYDQGRLKWQGDTLPIIWLDEEPPWDIYSEALTRTNRGDNGAPGILYMTATPLLGLSDVMEKFYPEPDTADKSLTMMALHEVPGLTKEQRDQIIASYKPHERKARTEGIPTLGSGKVFPVEREMLEVPAFDIPDHWTRIIGSDFGGFNHPTAFVDAAYDRETKTFYVTNVYKRSEAVVAVHAAAIRPWGTWKPIAWPHDGWSKDKQTGVTTASAYREEGLAMMLEHATHPEGGFSTEAGLSGMLQAMMGGRFKVFAHLSQFWEEFDRYHRKDGELVKKFDDIMSATRTGWMMRRFARSKIRPSYPVSAASYDPFNSDYPVEYAN